ncbi:hypothetical protein [Veronia nyctiphanis]|uniref:hypothetical protein n=1 Tax=Veronia nyctiphanis TaxID=1278244 RepID=UPI0011AEB1EC|nr:hypothetical protein [Veronia nyctiphanis]
MAIILLCCAVGVQAIYVSEHLTEIDHLSEPENCQVCHASIVGFDLISYPALQSDWLSVKNNCVSFTFLAHVSIAFSARDPPNQPVSV